MTPKPRTGRTLLLLMLALMLAVAACGTKKEDGNVNSQNEGTAEPIQQAAPEPEPEPEPEPAGFPAPLTGLLQETEPLKRPVAVMINNYSAARPQSGLPHADVVWEMLAEGGITRLIAIYQSNETYDGPVGPIRSIRPYLIELAESYRAVISHAGGSDEAYGILRRQQKEYLDEITNAGPYFVRDKSRKAPHNLYSDLANLRTGAEKKGYAASVELPVFPFLDAAAPEPAGDTASKIEIRFSLKNYIVSYDYDAATGTYARSINGEPHTDLVSGDQLSTSNVAVLGTAHKVLDNEGRLAVDLKSGGPAMLFQRGKAITGTWERSDDGLIRLMKDGSELAFTPGTIYYHVVPDANNIGDHITTQP